MAYYHQDKKLTNIIEAISNPARIAMLEIMLEHPNTYYSSSDFVGRVYIKGENKRTIARYHLDCLRKEGFLKYEIKKGKRGNKTKFATLTKPADTRRLLDLLKSFSKRKKSKKK